MDKLTELPDIPPILKRELDEALAACKALLNEWNKHPLMFGIMPAGEWDSDLIPAEVRQGYSKGFVEKWTPIEQRYMRAKEGLERHREDPEANLDRCTARYVLSRFKEAALQAKAREHFRKTLGPYNTEKTKAKERAQDIARELWLANTDQEFRLSDMAKLVEDILNREGGAELPRLERIKEWIKPVAPDYARKGGRPRKVT